MKKVTDIITIVMAFALIAYATLYFFDVFTDAVIFYAVCLLATLTLGASSYMSYKKTQNHNYQSTYYLFFIASLLNLVSLILKVIDK